MTPHFWPSSRFRPERYQVPDASQVRPRRVFSTLQGDSRSIHASEAPVSRPHHRLRARLLCHALLVKQPEATLNQFFQPLDEACSWRPIDNIMIKIDG